jgi:hypothetical protein
MLAVLTLAVAASLQLADPHPLPPGHRPFGPPLREDVLQGWETFIGDANPPADAKCASIGEPMVVALNPPERDEAVRMLRSAASIRLNARTAARLLRRQPSARSLAVEVFENYLSQMRQRKHRAVVERRDSWSVADQNELDRLEARLATGDPSRYRPYLVRAVAKFGDGHDGAPFMSGDLCGDTLYLQTLTFSYSIPPSVRVPAVVFLPRAPRRVVSSVMVAW